VTPLNGTQYKIALPHQ